MSSMAAASAFCATSGSLVNSSGSRMSSSPLAGPKVSPSSLSFISRPRFEAAVRSAASAWSCTFSMASAILRARAV